MITYVYPINNCDFFGLMDTLESYPFEHCYKQLKVGHGDITGFAGFGSIGHVDVLTSHSHAVQINVAQCT